MFCASIFNQDISYWDTSKVKYMNWMFSASQFNDDISQWNVSSVEGLETIFSNCPAPVPYWAKIKNMQERLLAVEAYQTKKQLQLIIDNGRYGGSIIKI